MSLTQKERGKIIAESYRLWTHDAKNVLDVGCGNGVVSNVLRKRLDVLIHGTDIIDYRKEELLFTKMNESGKLPFPDNSFDIVMFNDMLHHSEEIESLLNEGKRIAKTILIFEDCESLLMKVLDAGVNYIYCSDMPIPFNFKTQKQWMELFANLNFQATIGKVSYPFWYPLNHMVFKLDRQG